MNAQTVQSKITEWCRTHGVDYATKISASINGVPDMMIVVRSHVMLVEIKYRKDRESELQELFREKANRYRKISFVARSLEDFIREFDYFCKINNIFLDNDATKCDDVIASTP